MKITVFASDQPRHMALIRRLSTIGQVTAVIEHAPKKDTTPVMKKYFAKVREAENYFFPMTLCKTIRSLWMKAGKLNNMTKEDLWPYLQSDYYVVFGSSYIKGWLCNFLVTKKAINIHMGWSPYYRGANCNAWAVYDGNLNRVGATIHYLTKGLDSGEIIEVGGAITLYKNSFYYTMSAVVVACAMIIRILSNIERKGFPVGEVQDKSKEIRYSTYKDWNDKIAEKIMKL